MRGTLRERSITASLAAELIRTQAWLGSMKTGRRGKQEQGGLARGADICLERMNRRREREANSFLIKSLGVPCAKGCSARRNADLAEQPFAQATLVYG